MTLNDHSPPLRALLLLTPHHCVFPLTIWSFPSPKSRDGGIHILSMSTTQVTLINNVKIMRKHEATEHTDEGTLIPAPQQPPAQNKNHPHIPVLGGCNCRNKGNCPVPGACKTKSVIYQAKVVEQTSGKVESYVGLTEGEFKTRFNNHTCSFRDVGKRGSTSLAEHIWKLKDDNLPYDIQWSFLKQTKSYTPSTGKCFLCLAEKHYIIFKPHLATLNNRAELSSTCRHKSKFLLDKT